MKLSVVYLSKTVNKTLSREYIALGRASLHGPPSRVATAVLKCAPVTQLVIGKVLRLLKTEGGDLCSKKKPSSLRHCTKEGLMNFDFEELCNEWKERVPILLHPFDGFRKPREDYNVAPKHGPSWVNFAKAKKPTHEC